MVMRLWNPGATRNFKLAVLCIHSKLALVIGGNEFSYIPTVDLIDGNRIPLAGIGMCCRPSAKGEAAMHGVIDYLNLGGRHIDDATMYDNHREVGMGIKAWAQNQTIGADEARRSLFLTTKIWANDFGYENTYRRVMQSLDELQTPYLDLVLIHVAGMIAPDATDPSCVTKEVIGNENFGDSVAPYDANAPIDQRAWGLCRLASWKALETLKDMGYIRSIGVSNWDIPKMDQLHKVAKHRIAVHQLELHPWFSQKEIVEYSKREKIVLTAYGSMGSNKFSKEIMEQEAFKQIGQGYGKTPGQILLRWAVQKGIVVIPGTGNPKHMAENLDVFDFQLRDDEMGFLDAIQGQHGDHHMYEHRPDMIL